MNLNLVRLALLVIAGAVGCAAERPNIVLILADDVGYSDIGCFGGEIATPNLDALAAGGLRFTNFYNSARCCPTRASLLTGLHPHQAGIGHMLNDDGVDSYRGELSRRSVTIAEALKPAGYRNYIAGKWHLTPGYTAEAQAKRDNWPLQRGFDRYYGTIQGAGSFWDPGSLVRDNTLLTVANDPEYRPDEYYYTDAISDHATKFIREHARDHARSPFFLYVPYTAPHWPMHARERDIAKQKGRYDAGYAALRAARWAKQKQLGVADATWGLAPTSGDWATVENKAFEARGMEVYAAMLTSMDDGIGRIVAALKATGQLDNTVILYLQDNGACAETNGREGPFTPRAAQPSLPPLAPDAKQYGFLPAQTRDGWPVRSGYGVMPGPADTYVAYGRDWANVSNTPFREYKHWVHEGGIATPLIVHWPAGISTARRGEIDAQPGHLIDLMATCVDLAGAHSPTKFNGETITPMEGVSLRPALQGKSLQRAQPIFWEHEGNRAVREDRWKLVSKFPGGWELYDMTADRTEAHDLSAKEPVRLKAMIASYHAWAKRAHVVPWPANPANGANKKKGAAVKSGEE
jgi:arylsulfatase A-like enzyme